MSDVEVRAVSYSYRVGRHAALRAVSFDVPTGGILGLLGANGAGKTTLLQCCAGLRRPASGRVLIDGRDVRARARIVDGTIGYVAEGVRLPDDLTLAQLERWLAPLHPRWDAALATQLRQRFDLDPARRIGTLSRGEYMKAALACALAPRPRVLLMDEPFTGIDVLVKDALVRGLLSAASDAATTMLIASHDIAELESVVSHLVILSGGHVAMTGAMEALRERYRRVTMVGGDEVLNAFEREQSWLEVARAGRQVSVVADAERTPLGHETLRRRFPAAESVTVEDLSLRELFSAVARNTSQTTAREDAA